MKSIYVHVFYLSIIAFLGYNYWSSVQVFKAFEHLDRQLRMDYEVIDNGNEMVYQGIDKTVKAYLNTQNLQLLGETVLLRRTIDSTVNFINSNKKQLIDRSNGLDTRHNAFSINAIKTTQLFFDEAKINEIKGKLSDYAKLLFDLSKDDRLKELYNTPKLILDDNYWQSIKNLPVSGVLAELSFIQNHIKYDEILLSNYYFSMGCQDIKFDRFRTVIAPKKAAIFEGEDFESDIFLAAYSSNLGRNAVIEVDGKRLETYQGLAHFASKNQTVGTKTIKAKTIIKHPLTGQTETTEGSFEYQVLPKCSRDCQ